MAVEKYWKANSPMGTRKAYDTRGGNISLTRQSESDKEIEWYTTCNHDHKTKGAAEACARKHGWPLDRISSGMQLYF